MSIIFETCQFNLLLVLPPVNEAFSAFVVVAVKLDNSYCIHAVMVYSLLFFCNSNLFHIYV